MPTIKIGLERFITRPPSSIGAKRLGLLCNPASVDSRLQHARDLVAQRFPGRLKALFSPQHGFYAEKQDNMVESGDLSDERLGIPVFSLYGRVRQPTEVMFDLIDTLIVDLQDVGTRVYTFVYTMAYCMQSAARLGKSIIVLDRPNPIGGHRVEGNCLRDDLTSFVGLYPIPMRHGLTIGELAGLFNVHYGINCDLAVIPMQGWQRRMQFKDTGRIWVPPSPNLPTPASAAVYPGQVLWEGTNVSEGRGTCQPFELFGAPYIDHRRLRLSLAAATLDGLTLREHTFEPTFNKWQGRRCNGFQLHVTAPQRYCPYFSSLEILKTVYNCWPDRFQWKPPPYEYETVKLPFDLIAGDREVRRCIEENADLSDLKAAWQPELKAFLDLSRRFYLYQG